MEWNQGQKEAIEHKEGPALVVAGPGSGKTAVIVHHIRFLLEAGIPGKEILVLTFTRAAAAEMEERFLKLAGEAEGGAEAGEVTFGTFHSLCFRILKEQYGYTQKSFLSEEEKKKILKEILFRRRMLQTNAEAQMEKLLSEIARKKGGAAEEEWDPVTEEIYEDYQGWLRREHRLDFDDLLILCLEFLRESGAGGAAGAAPGRRGGWGAVLPWRYFLVDEYQDLNRMQIEIVQMLAGRERNVFAVGDEDQSIYRFRGAYPGGMMAFARDYPGTKQLLLTVNYRSVPGIVMPALQLIGHNQERFQKKITSARSGTEAAVSCRCYEEAGEENTAIAAEMRRLHEQGMAWEEMAVLFRSSASSRSLVRCLKKQQIPFACREIPAEEAGTWVIRDLEAYRSLAGSRMWRRRDLLRVLNRPERGLPGTGLEEERIDPREWCAQFRGIEGYEDAAADLCRLVGQLKQMDRYASVSYLRRGTGYGDYVRACCREKEIPEEDVWKQVEAWCREEQKGKDEEETSGRAAEAKGVRLMTMHASKGLEFPAVFLPGLNEGTVPHSRAQSEQEVEEERRLMYVAVTRAKDRLYLSWVRKRYQHQLKVSRFVAELGVKPQAQSQH